MGDYRRSVDKLICVLNLQVFEEERRTKTINFYSTELVYWSALRFTSLSSDSGEKLKK
jgi:hypothetical protein